MRSIYENINHIFAHASGISPRKGRFLLNMMKIVSARFLSPSSDLSHSHTQTTHAGYLGKDSREEKRQLVVEEYTWAVEARLGRHAICLHSAYEIMTLPSVCGMFCRSYYMTSVCAGLWESKMVNTMIKYRNNWWMFCIMNIYFVITSIIKVR